MQNYFDRERKLRQIAMHPTGGGVRVAEQR